MKVIATGTGYEIYNISSCEGSFSKKTSIKTNFDGLILNESIYGLDENACAIAYAISLE